MAVVLDFPTPAQRATRHAITLVGYVEADPDPATRAVLEDLLARPLAIARAILAGAPAGDPHESDELRQALAEAPHVTRYHRRCPPEYTRCPCGSEESLA